MGNKSIGYQLLKRLGLNYSESEYGNVSIKKIISKTFRTLKNEFLLKCFMNSILLSPISPRLLRPKVLRWVGCKVGKNVFIGGHVLIDSGHAELITLEDNVHITTRCLLLCHQRDLSSYFKGDDIAKLPYKLAPIKICRGVHVGMNSMVMPGVTIGEGAIIGAYSLVTKDIPAWTIATGRPAKVVKNIASRD